MNVLDLGPLETAITPLQRGGFPTFATTLKRFIDTIHSTENKAIACVAWRFWLGALSNKGGRGQRNREKTEKTKQTEQKAIARPSVSFQQGGPGFQVRILLTFAVTAAVTLFV